MAQTACSREDPHPKLDFEINMFPYLKGFLFKMNDSSSFRVSVLSSVAVDVYLSESNKKGPKPDFLIDFKYCFGIIRSVSTLSLLIGIT
jgi:hypothetical protein